MAWFKQMQSVRGWVRRYGRGRVKIIEREMTDEEVAALDQSFDKLHDAFDDLNKTFRKMRL